MNNQNIPAKGFYYHYKHDPKGLVNDYAYEVVNIGYHTELKGDDAMLVIYRPLYEAFVYKQGRRYDVRPLKMFMETVVKDGKTIPRFTPITNSKVLAELEAIKRQMYGE
ncbi:MAG TPA: DUF1653 domain-containing protein [Candidatus Paceibacterota bacterium]|nr:DUF1653 domain-containing protein [Candidatus Paceibacterota bacterium]